MQLLSFPNEPPQWADDHTENRRYVLAIFRKESSTEMQSMTVENYEILMVLKDI